MRMENTEFNRLDSKIRNIENQLKPILSSPRNPDTTRSDQLLLEEFHQCLKFMKDGLSSEMAEANEPRHLQDVVKRVIHLQKAAHAWTEGRPVDMGEEGSSLSSFVESCVTDSDSGLAGFTVYENRVFDGVPGDGDDDDDDDDEIGDDSTVDNCEVDEFERNEEDNMADVADPDEVPELEAVSDSVEKKVLEVDHQKEANVIKVDEEEEENKAEQENDEYEDELGDEDEGTQKCCYNILFWGGVTVMVWMYVLIDFSSFSDNSSVVLLTPT